MMDPEIRRQAGARTRVVALIGLIVIPLLVGHGVAEGVAEPRVGRVGDGGLEPERVDLDIEVLAIAVGEGALWVTGSSPDDDTAPPELLRLDPATGEIIARVPLQGFPREIAVGGGAVWVADTIGGVVQRVDVATNRVVATVQLPTAEADDIAVGLDSVWVTEFDVEPDVGVVHRIDPSTNTIVATTELDEKAVWVTVGDDAAWISSGPGGRLHRIDAASGELTSKRVRRAKDAGTLVAAAGNVWVTDRGTGRIARIDEAQRKQKDSIELPRRKVAGRFGNGELDHIAVGEDSVWVTTGITVPGFLFRIDESDRKLTASVKLRAFSGGQVAVADGVVWIGTDVETFLYRVEL